MTGVLALHSLSKRSNLAGYRAGFVSGDPDVLAELLAVRKNLGLMMPAPVQHAAAVALGDDEHVSRQRERYTGRRRRLRAALVGAGFRVDHSDRGAVPVGDPGRALRRHGGLAGRAGHAGGTG